MSIGVLGGYGDVGGASVRQLLSLELGPLRIGGRDVEAARRFVDELPAGHVEYQVVDFRDEASLTRFAAGCHILLNCAGPSHAIGDRAARAAVSVMADYVDVAGDDVLHGLLNESEYLEHKRVAVLSAGLQPGLTGLLPRWAAQREFTKVHSLISYFGLLDHFTEVAADDYLQGVVDKVSEPLAAWRDGHRSAVLTRRRNVAVPFFPRAATVLPYLNAEGERLAAALGITRADWYTVLTGRHIGTAFDRARTLERREAAATLRRASLLDLAESAPYVVLLVQLDGLRDGVPITRTMVLRGQRNAELTGAVAALTTLAVHQGELPYGCHFAATALEPQVAADRLIENSAVTSLTILDDAIEALGVTEEGVL